MSRFWLTTREGAGLGHLSIAAIRWMPGDIIPRDGGPNLLVLEVSEPAPEEGEGILFVEEHD